MSAHEGSAAQERWDQDWDRASKMQDEAQKARMPQRIVADLGGAPDLTNDLNDERAKVEGLTLRLARLDKEHGEALASLVKVTARAQDLERDLEIERTRGDVERMRSEHLRKICYGADEELARLRGAPLKGPSWIMRQAKLLRDALVAAKKVIDDGG